MTKVLATIGDLHANSTVALCPPVFENENGTHLPTEAQEWLWACWLDYWSHVKTSLKPSLWQKTLKLWLVVNGDMFEGRHHGTTEIITGDEEIQQDLGQMVLQPGLDLEPEFIFFTKGTSPHVGQAAKFERFFAKSLAKEGYPVVPNNETGSYVWDYLPLMVEGVYFDIAHHGKAGRLPHTTGPSMVRNAVYHEQKLRSAGEKIPDVAIRSHTHRGGDSGELNTAIRWLSLWPWQLTTDFGNYLDPGVILPVGGFWFICDKGGYDFKHKKYQGRRTPPWSPDQYKGNPYERT